MKLLYWAWLRRQKQICVFVHFLDTLWVENFDEITLFRTVEIEANLCFAIFGKNSKIQNGGHFWGGENFLKIAKSTLIALLLYGSKISMKLLYLARLKR